jgi:hypothetical protein
MMQLLLQLFWFSRSDSNKLCDLMVDKLSASRFFRSIALLPENMLILAHAFDVYLSDFLSQHSHPGDSGCTVQ